MNFYRKKEDILNDIHSAEGRVNSSEIKELQKELEMIKIRQQIENDINTEEKDEKDIEELKNLIKKPTKEEIQEYIKKNTDIVLEENTIDNKTIELIAILEDIQKNNPEKKEIIKEIIKKYVEKILNIEKKIKEYLNKRGEDSYKNQ